MPHQSPLRTVGFALLLSAGVIAGLLTLPAHGQTTATGVGGATAVAPDITPSVPVLERGRESPSTGVGSNPSSPAQRQGTAPPVSPAVPLSEKPQPTEFESYVRRLAGDKPVERFGVRLVTPGTTGADAADLDGIVPPEYVVQVGDEVAVTIWGSVDADLRVVVDRSGRISIPRVGSVMLGGVRYADLAETLRRRIAQVFKNFDLSVSLGQLRGVRVYVTGFVRNPGSVVVHSLSTVTSVVLQAGGPSSAGSLRNIELLRGGRVVAHLDLYELLLQGNKGQDLVVQAGDVVRVAAVGRQVALLGSVNQPAIFELSSTDTVADVLRMAGGFAATADTSRLTLERLDDRSTVRVVELSLPTAYAQPLRNADVLHAFSAVNATLPVVRQNKRVHVEGEVDRPGDYLLPPDSTLLDAIRLAGGLTPLAYVYGTEFSRESVRVQQEQNYERALRDLETDLMRLNNNRRVSTAEEATAQASRASSVSRLIERLRGLRPTGRIVLQLTPEAAALPQLALEDGDRVYVPPKPVTVGVFGSVFNPGSYLFADQRKLADYLELAGGPTRTADKSAVFVVRANGTVASALQGRSWFGLRDNFATTSIQPGDTIFAPEQAESTTFVQDLKDWTLILYQFGLGIAGLKIVGF